MIIQYDIKPLGAKEITLMLSTTGAGGVICD